MHFVIIGISIGLLLAAIMSLIGGHYISSLLQLVPVSFLVIAKYFPNNFLTESLGSTVSPVPREGILKSRLAFDQSMFYAKIAIILISVFLLCENSGVEIDMSNTKHPVVLLLYLIPLSTIFVVCVSLYYGLKYAYIKVFKRDAVWSEKNN